MFTNFFKNEFKIFLTVQNICLLNFKIRKCNYQTGLLKLKRVNNKNQQLNRLIMKLILSTLFFIDNNSYFLSPTTQSESLLPVIQPKVTLLASSGDLLILAPMGAKVNP